MIRSIQMRIALLAGLCLAVAAASIIGYAAITLRDTATKAAEAQAVTEAKSHAASIKAEFEVALDTARTMAQALSAVKSKETSIMLTRDEVNAMLRQLTADNPDFIGTYTLWEPDAFDGKDAEYAGKAPYGQTGRFIAYWNRNEQGEIRVETPLYYEKEGPGDYYQCPKKTKQECIINPYVYPVQGKDVLMTSMVVPIVVDGKFYGIAGVDVGLESLQKRADEVNLYDKTGKLVLIANDGTLAGVTGQPKLVGKPVGDLYKRFGKDELARIQRGEDVVEPHGEGDLLEVYVPIKFGHTTTPWSVSILVPNAKITASTTSQIWQPILIGVFFALVALALLWWVAGRITRPLKGITEVAKAVAGGHLEVEAQVESTDEVGVLAGVFNQMIIRLREMLRSEREQREHLQATITQYVEHMAQVARGNLSARVDVNRQGRGIDDPLTILGNQLNETTASLQRMIAQIRDAANNLSAAAAEILSATTQQASGASEQSAAISQTTTTVDEVKTIAEQASARAQEVAGASQRTVEVSRSGQRAVQDTLESMNQIKERVEGIAENILALSEQTQQIGEIITTVNDIASQSNILALNASIEAARAGEHGKGFAVVAVEVRNLAEQSRQATAQVKAILSEIQKATNATVMATEEGTKRVDKGVELTAQARRAIEQLSGVINESAQAAAQMVAGGRQQVSGIEQIALAMQNINQATVQSLSSTRQAEKSAQSLNELARSLTEAVARYKL